MSTSENAPPAVSDTIKLAEANKKITDLEKELSDVQKESATNAEKLKEKDKEIAELGEKLVLAEEQIESAKGLIAELTAPPVEPEKPAPLLLSCDLAAMSGEDIATALANGRCQFGDVPANSPYWQWRAAQLK